MGTLCFLIFVSVSPIMSNLKSSMFKIVSNSSLCLDSEAMLRWNIDKLFFLVLCLKEFISTQLQFMGVILSSFFFEE